MNVLFGILGILLFSCSVDSLEHHGNISPIFLPKGPTQREGKNPSSNGVTVEIIFHKLKDLISSVDLIAERLKNTSKRVKTGELLLRPFDANGHAAVLQNFTDTSIKMLAGLATIRKLLLEDNPTYVFPVVAIQNNIEATLQTLEGSKLMLHDSIGESEQKLQEISHLLEVSFRGQEDSKHELQSIKSEMNSLDQFINDYKDVSGLVDEAHLLLESYPTF